MPNSTDNDAMPAWLKGDLPAAPPDDQSEGTASELPHAEPEAEASAAAASESDTPAEAEAVQLHAAEPEGADATLAGGDADVAAQAGSGEDPQPGSELAIAAGALGEGVAALEALAAARAGDMPANEVEGEAAPSAELGAGEVEPAEGGNGTGPSFGPARAWDSPAEEDAADVSEAEAQRAGAILRADVPVSGRPRDDEETPPPAAEPPPPMTLPQVEPLDLEALVEALLFVADGAVTVGQLAEALEVHARDVESALAGLVDGYARRGLSLQRMRDKVQLTTAPAAAAAVERFLGLAAATPLSRAALESLAIIAYQQPVTRPQIEAVRGVNSDSVIKNLLSKGLIEESGRAEGPGRPVLYSTTPEFMQHFGLSTLSELPPLALAEAGAQAPSQDEILKG